MRAIIGAAAILFPAQAQAQSRGTEAQPLEPLHHYFSTDDYPEAAVQRQAHGTVSFTVVVSRRGVPSRCIIDQSSSEADLDRATCAILMRVPFAPARTARGRAIDGRFSNQVRWVLPEPTILPAGTIPLIPFRITATGGIRAGEFHCRTAVDGHPLPAPALADCDPLELDGGKRALRALGRNAELTRVTVMEPDNARPPTDPDDHGELIAELVARLTISPDGGVADCRTVQRSIFRLPQGMDEPVNICATRLGGNTTRFYLGEPVPTEPQFATVRIRLYLRDGGAAPAR